MRQIIFFLSEFVDRLELLVEKFSCRVREIEQHQVIVVKVVLVFVSVAVLCRYKIQNFELFIVNSF